MSTLVLIRHGQASLEGADYDVLSARGIEQSRLLGEHLAAAGERFDVLAMGPLKRHRGTAEGVREGARRGGLELPTPTLLPGLDEFPAIEIMRSCVDGLAARDPEIAALQRDLHATVADPARRGFRRAFERLFQALMRRWIDGVFDDAVESYASFQARVDAAVDALLAAAGRGVRIAAVTSAGPVGAAVRSALNLAPWDAMRATFVVANASMSIFKHRPGELTLTAFNGVPHLRDPALVTLR
ncbi:MAG: histidine phosphatase family protein [Nannocystaceae bacterium]